MNKKELIKILENFDDDMPIILFDDEGCAYELNHVTSYFGKYFSLLENGIHIKDKRFVALDFNYLQ